MVSLKKQRPKGIVYKPKMENVKKLQVFLKKINNEK